MVALKKTCSDTPATWEQRCRVAEAETRRVEAERVAMAKQIHALNLRVTFDATSEERIAQLTKSLEQQYVQRDAREKAHAEAVLKLTEKLSESRAEATDLREQLAELEARDDSEPADLDVDAEIDALTDVIRAAKTIRRRWRGE